MSEESIESIKRIIDDYDELLNREFIGGNGIYVGGYRRGITQCIAIAEVELAREMEDETMKLKDLGKITALPESVAERHWLLDHITYLDVLKIIDEEMDTYAGTDTLSMDDYDRGYYNALRVIKAQITLHAQTPRDML